MLQVLSKTRGSHGRGVYVYQGFLDLRSRHEECVILVEVGKKGKESIALLKIIQHLVQTLLELASQGTEMVDPSEGTEADVPWSRRVVLERDLLVHMGRQGDQTVTNVSRGIGAYRAVLIVLFSSKGLVESIDESPPLFKGILAAVGLSDPIRQGNEVFYLILDALEKRQCRR
jgi:hypothetical protein